MDERGMTNKVSAQYMREGDPLTMAVAAMVVHAMEGGVTSEGETCTMLVPSFQAGPDLDHLIDVGEWEIVIKKVNGDVGDVQ